MEETPDSLRIDNSQNAPLSPIVIGASDTTLCRIDDCRKAITEKVNSIAYAPYAEGIKPSERPVLPGYDSGILVILMVVFLIVTSNVRHASTYIKTFAQDLLSVRRRSNAFDDHTVAETRITASFILLACVCEGIMLFSGGFGAALSAAATPLAGVAMAICVAAAYYLFEVAAYSTVGWVFGGKFAYTQWIKGFNASQSLLGITLIVPALIVLFNPSLGKSMTIIAIVLYGLARFIFICKGFRIFYKNPYSLIYFILYLCALEIAPLVSIFKMSSIPSGALNL